MNIMRETKVDLKNTKFPDVFHQLLEEQRKEWLDKADKILDRHYSHHTSLVRCGFVKHQKNLELER